MNINNIFMKKTFQKTLVRRVTLLHTFANLPSGLIDDSWTLLSMSAFNLLQCVFLVDVYEKIVSCRYSVGTQKHILIAFQIISGYSSLIYS